MKVLYIAGPYSSLPEGYDSYHGTNHNINEASRWAREAALKGWAPLCPHKNTAGFQVEAKITYDFWIAVGLELLKRADAILLIPGWERSSGAIKERDLAFFLGKPIYYAHDGVPLPSLPEEPS